MIGYYYDYHRKGYLLSITGTICLVAGHGINRNICSHYKDRVLKERLEFCGPPPLIYPRCHPMLIIELKYVYHLKNIYTTHIYIFNKKRIYLNMRSK